MPDRRPCPQLVRAHRNRLLKNHVQVIVPLLYRLTRRTLSIPAVLLRRIGGESAPVGPPAGAGPGQPVEHGDQIRVPVRVRW
jgi:hypothetical protein